MIKGMLVLVVFGLILLASGVLEAVSPWLSQIQEGLKILQAVTGG